MHHWTPMPAAGAFAFTAETVTHQWAVLHCGDAQAMPTDTRVLAAWVACHNGDFTRACALGLAAGGDGITVANRATCAYASYLEPKEARRLALFEQVAQRAHAQQSSQPTDANAYFLEAYALARYAQGINVAKALAQGIGQRVKAGLERAIALEPAHAHAHVVLGAFHAEVIDKVGALVASMTHGANREAGLAAYAQALQLHPTSAIVCMEVAQGWVMLDGPARQTEAHALLERAAATRAIDAIEYLDVTMAVRELSH